MGYRLSWTPVSSATSYKLEYSIDGSGYMDLTTTTNNYYDLSEISAGGDYVLSVISQATGYTDSDRATIEYKPRAVAYTLTNCSASLQKTVTQYGATFPSFSISPASGYDFGTGATYSVYNGTTPVTLTVSDGIITVPEFIVGGAVTVSVSATSTNYSVTNTLANCTSNNSATSVSHGASYSATLTADSGYTLTGGDYSVYMGGNDITANSCTVNSDGTITIGIMECYGEITIDFVAVEDVPAGYSVTMQSTADINGHYYSIDNGLTWIAVPKNVTTVLTGVTQFKAKVIGTNSKWWITMWGYYNFGTNIFSIISDDAGTHISNNITLTNNLTVNCSVTYD